MTENGVAAPEEGKTTNEGIVESNGVANDKDQRESPEDDANGTTDNRAKQAVEYYINYLDQERPMDRWVRECMVRINDKLVEKLLEDFNNRELEKKKNRELQTFL